MSHCSDGAVLHLSRTDRSEVCPTGMTVADILEKNRAEDDPELLSFSEDEAFGDPPETPPTYDTESERREKRIKKTKKPKKKK